MRLSGFPAWWLWRTVYLVKFSVLVSPGQARVRLDLGTHVSEGSWACGTNQTERVTRAHYRPGDDIFLEGSSGTQFYVIDRGEVEFIRRDHAGQANQIVWRTGAR